MNTTTGDGAITALIGKPRLSYFMGGNDVTDAGVARFHDFPVMATEQIAGLWRLKTYYAGKTSITDRSLEILSRMSSLESLTFWHCAGITDAGVALLAGLPRLREVHFEGGMPNVTLEGIAVFPPHVRVEYWG